uniref:Uncharacterized protein n=1 Tax=Knipowitschia caucasica TaxID=637954 RepID=A0AAV2IVV6_KNICA
MESPTSSVVGAKRGRGGCDVTGTCGGAGVEQHGGPGDGCFVGAGATILAVVVAVVVVVAGVGGTSAGLEGCPTGGTAFTCTGGLLTASER